MITQGVRSVRESEIVRCIDPLELREQGADLSSRLAGLLPRLVEPPQVAEAMSTGECVFHLGELVVNDYGVCNFTREIGTL